jgi:ABC-2 type transport system permease protein
VYIDGLRTSLGIGRGGRAKVLPWLFIAISVTVALVLALIAGTAERLGGAGTAESLDLPSHSDYYGIASIILFIFAAIAAPELLCPDRRSGAISLYLVRPLSGSDYVLARWASFLTIMFLVAWLPQVVLFAGLALGDPEPGDYLADNWLDVPRFLAAGAAIGIYTTSLAMAVAGFTTRRAYAAAFLIGLFVISTPVTIGLAQSIGGTTGQWISMFNLTNVPLHLNDLVFDSTSNILNESPSLELPRVVRVGWFFVLSSIAGVLMWNKYRRMSV